MSENLGSGVSYVNDPTGYAYDTVVFQKGKPPLDSELNLVQQISHEITRRGLSSMPSGWLSFRNFKTDPLLKNKFYTQDPSDPVPEFAVVNGMVVHVTGTNTQSTNLNIVDLGNPPSTANALNGIYLEVWRALLSPDTNLTNGVPVKPESGVTIDNFLSVDAIDNNHGWIVGQNGVILQTSNGGASWSSQYINTPNNLNSIFAVSLNIVWTVGDNGTIGRTTNGGQTWNVVASGRTENFKSVFALSQNIAWLVGDNGTILHTTNGVTWLSLNSGINNDLRSLWFLSSGIVGWAVGAGGTILKTVDGGAHWLRLTTNITADLNSVLFFDTNIGFAVGEGNTILRSSDGGATWINQSANVTNAEPVNYTDIALSPNLDQYANGEDVSSQTDGINKVFQVMSTPITFGNGKGQTFSFTATPPSITDARPIVDVKVNGVSVMVDNINGTTGQITLHTAPVYCADVKVYYYYKVSSALFNGRLWISGTNDGSKGVILRSDDLGQTLVKQDPNSGLDINAVFMTDKDHGWIVGNASIIRHTISGGTVITGDPSSGWVEQLSSVLERQTQRVFLEGNNPQAGTYLLDDSINPNANIETTKRIQIQYAIRVASNVDPFNYPESGLGAGVIVGLGPNSSGTFSFENMGTVKGDYGLWRAECLNTVDGYTYAIPMFFVNRRNTTDYNALSNTNGQSNFMVVLTNGSNIRPDQLTAANVVDSDILDVRRRITNLSVEELLNAGMDSLLSNELKTRIILDSNGGDKYGTQLLQLDRVSGLDTDGGYLIPNANLSQAVQGQIASNVTVSGVVFDTLAPQNDSTSSLVLTADSNAIFHQNPAQYSAVYRSLSVPARNRAPLPGDFTNIGTAIATFTPNVGAQTATQVADPTLFYEISAFEIQTSSTTLSKIPADPRLVKNYSTNNTSVQAIYYQGIFDNQTSGKIVEQWDSGVSGLLNYSIAYPGSGTTTADTIITPSTVDLHYFVVADSSNVDPTGLILSIDPTKLGPDATSLYPVMTVSQVRNVTAGFTYKIINVAITSSLIQIQSAPGFGFNNGSTFEIIGKVLTTAGNKNVRNGATVNFSASNKGISTFCVSDKLRAINKPSAGSITLYVSDGLLSGLAGSIIGISSAERIPQTGEIGSILPFCWVDPTNSANPATIGRMYPITNVIFDPLSSSVSFTIIGTSGLPASVAITIQALVLQSSLIYNDDGTQPPNAGLLIGYYYNTAQSVVDLPASLTIETLSTPQEITISNLGTGGSLFPKEPFINPIANIPVNDPLINNDDQFYNVESMVFPGISVNGGFVQLPVFVPGNFGTLTFSVPATDLQGRGYYSACSKEVIFRTESMQVGAPRKIFMGVLGKVSSASDLKFMKGEHVLIVFSRNALLEKENYTGFKTGGNSVIAVYRLPHRPIIRS